MLRPGEIDLAGRFFDVELLHHPVLDQHRIALRACPEAAAGGVEIEACGFGEFAIAVGEELDLAVGAARLGPGGEDEMIVDRGHRSDVDALVLERLLIGEEAGQMVLMAGRREGAGQAEKDDLLAAEEIARRDRQRPVLADQAECGVGQTVADFDCHGSFLKWARLSRRAYLSRKDAIASRRAAHWLAAAPSVAVVSNAWSPPVTVNRAATGRSWSSGFCSSVTRKQLWSCGEAASRATANHQGAGASTNN